MTRLKTRALVGAAIFAIATFASPASAQRINNIVAFGDSYADDGNLFQLTGTDPLTTVIYTTGRFSGGTNYIDTLSQLLNAPVQNFAIGGALTNNTNTNSPFLPGFTFEYTSFLAGGGGVFPTVSGTFDEGDLVAISVGGNDARFYQQTGGTLAGAPAAATASAGFATTGLNALVGAGAQNISFLAGNTALLPEVASDPAAQEVRNAFSTTFNNAIQSSLAGYAANGVMVHYLDLTMIFEQIQANPGAYGITNGISCPAFPDPTCIVNSSGYLIYDGLHLTSQGFAIVGQYVATQLQAPLTLAAPSDLGLDTARQFGRTLTSRVDLGSPRDGEVAEGVKFFVVGDTFARDIARSDSTDAFDVDGVGGTIGAEFGFANGVAGLAANYTRGRANFTGDPAHDKSRTIQLGAYAGYAVGPLFVQGHLGYGWDKHRLTREGVVEDMQARPDGKHWTAGAKAGYLMPAGSLRVGPVIALDYAKAKVDDYTESGDPALTLSVDDVNLKALTGNLGIEARGDFEGGGVNLRPFISAMAEKEFSGDGRIVRFAQTSAPGIVNSWDLGDRDKGVYGRLTGGASAAIFTGGSLDLNVSSTFGKDDGDELGAHLGFRMGF